MCGDLDNHTATLQTNNEEQEQLRKLKEMAATVNIPCFGSDIDNTCKLPIQNKESLAQENLK